MASADAVVDLLGVLAYGELSAFDHLAEDARLAPDLPSRSAMSDVAAFDYANYGRLVARMRSLGVDPFAAMAPYVAAIEGYHALTSPSTWLEAVMKAYLGDGLAADFYREVASFADGDTAALIDEVLRAGDRAELAVAAVRGAIAADPSVAGRLALWGRRLVGEAISQTQHVLAERDSLMLLFVEGTGDVAGGRAHHPHHRTPRGADDRARVGQLSSRIATWSGRRSLRSDGRAQRTRTRTRSCSSTVSPQATPSSAGSSRWSRARKNSTRS